MTTVTERGAGRGGNGAGTVAIDVDGLTKSYGDLQAVKAVEFSVPQGEIFAFLGPNGAGKSTTINMLCTLAHPTSGEARVAGFDVATRPKAVRRHIGLVFQEQTLDDQLTAEENLRFHAVLYGVPHDEIDARIARVMELVDARPTGERTWSRRSRGGWPAAWRSPGACSTRPRSCSWTSRPSASTPRPGP